MYSTEKPMLLANSSSGECLNGKTRPALSVVIPAFCERGNLLNLYQELTTVLSGEKITWELIIVDDGSTDTTWVEILGLHRRDTRVRGVRLSRNFGHQFALFAGMSHAVGRVVVTMDADLQHPPEVIPQLLSQWRRGSKIVHTVRIDHEDIGWWKRITSRFFYKIFSLLSGVEISAGMADFRLLDRQVVNELLHFNERNLFIRGLINWLGYSSSSVEFKCRARFSGKSKYTLRKMLKFAWTGLSSFSIVPLRIAIILGAVTSLIAFCGIAYAFWGKLFDKAVPGWASMMGIDSLLFGVLFMMLGIIGEYVGRILDEVRRRPRFFVEERVGFAIPEADAADLERPSFSNVASFGDYR